jgi:hypothetical protein
MIITFEEILEKVTAVAPSFRNFVRRQPATWPLLHSTTFSSARLVFTVSNLHVRIIPV